MFLRKTKSTPILKTSSTLFDKNEQLNRNIDRLQTMIDDMIKEYEYMDQPLKYPRKPEPLPFSSLSQTDQFNQLLSILYPQQNHDSFDDRPRK
jgi:hypothetical protein